MELIKNKTLLRLKIHIFIAKYLEKRALCFIEVIENDEKIIEDSKEVETVSDSEEESKKRFYVKRRGMHGLYHLQQLVRLRRHLLCLFLGLFLHLRLHLLYLCLGCPLFYYPLFYMSMPMPGSSAFLLSTLLSMFDVSIPVPGLSALPFVSSVSSLSVFVSELSVLLSVSGMSVVVPGLLIPSSVSGIAVPIFGLSTPLSVSGVFVPMPGSSVPLSVSGVPISRLSALPFSPAIPMPRSGLFPSPFLI